MNGQANESIATFSEDALRPLAELSDVREGLPVSSHRSVLGPAIVAAKLGFRWALRPFLNETLRKQAIFNETLVDWLRRSTASLDGVTEELHGVEHEIARFSASLGIRTERLGHAAPISPVEAGEHFDEIPVELLFTEGASYAGVEATTVAWFDSHGRWADLPFARLRPHLSLFEYFMERGGLPEPYFAWNDAVYETRGLAQKESREQLLDRRYREFRSMEKRLQTKGFERDLAVSVEYNPRGYFNVRDGHHRTAFLLCRGARRIPVRMTLADRMAWAPQRKQEAVIAELERFPERLIYTPILAPLGYHRVSERDVSYPTRLDHVLRWLGPTRLVGKRLLDVGSNIGYFAQHFAREGAIVTAIEPDPEHVRLAELLSELSGVRYELRRGRFEDCELEPHDVGLMLSVFYHFARNTALRERFLSRVRTTIRETLFWESGDDPETEKRWLIEGTHLKQYEKLADTYGTGKVRELGVFWAP